MTLPDHEPATFAPRGSYRLLTHARDTAHLTALCGGAGGLLVTVGGVIAVNCLGCRAILAEAVPA